MSSRTLSPVPIGKAGVQPTNLTEMLELARALAYSNLVPKAFHGKTPDVLVAMQMGAEVGLSPMAALKNIAVINGRPTLWGDACLSLVQAHPQCEDVIETFDEATWCATCIVKRRGRSDVTATFSRDDAKTAGLWGKAGPWTQYPKRMLQMRARGFALRDQFPDALGGYSVAEEVLDIPVSASVLSPQDFSDAPTIDTTEHPGVDVKSLKALAESKGVIEAVAEQYGPPDGWEPYAKEISEMLGEDNG